jgi:hypothetical protein
MSSPPNTVNFEFFNLDDGRVSKFGRSNKARLKQSFKNTKNPAIPESFSNLIAQKYQSILDGSSEATFNLSDDLSYSKALYGFSSIKMDYNDAPDWSEIKNALQNNGEGNPESPWVPNGNSPVGSTNADGMYISSTNPSNVPPVDEIDLKKPSDVPFAGEGHQLSPSNSSSKISKQNLFLRKNLGRSSQ